MPKRRSQNLNPGKDSKSRAGRGGKTQPRRGFRGGRPALNTDGYPPQAGGAEYEADIIGGHTYYREADGQTYYGQDAIDMYEQDHPGEGGPHDGLTGESGTYGGWEPSDGSGDQDEFEDDRWGARQY